MRTFVIRFVNFLQHSNEAEIELGDIISIEPPPQQSGIMRQIKHSCKGIISPHCSQKIILYLMYVNCQT